MAFDTNLEGSSIMKGDHRHMVLDWYINSIRVSSKVPSVGTLSKDLVFAHYPIMRLLLNSAYKNSQYPLVKELTHC